MTLFYEFMTLAPVQDTGLSQARRTDCFTLFATVLLKTRAHTPCI